MPSDIVGTKVVKYFDDCLKTKGVGLDDDGLRIMGEMVGEVIDNCKRHSGKNGEWFTLGHYKNNEDCGECHLVFFNFGDTIYESLKNSAESYIIKTLENMSSRHNLNWSSKWTKENLWTLYALQDGVSRCKKDESADNGSGTIKLIESFNSIGQTKENKNPKMSITSGSTNILFDGTYTLKEDANLGKKIIAFNINNNLGEKPDPEYVKSLKSFFPGTVISMRFFLDRRFILENCLDKEV